MQKKKILAGLALALILAVSTGLPQSVAISETADGAVTINGPQVLPPL
ncbi:hypothetical protein [Planococcus sp. A6]|nr:hypothetical protein [Planococcus sp. A6]